MLIRRIIVLVFFGGFFATTIQAEENLNLVNYYETECIKVNYNMFGGISLQAYGQMTSIVFGISPIFQEKLKKYPDSRVTLESYKTKNSIGNLLLWGGLAASLYGTYSPILSVDSYDYYSYPNSLEAMQKSLYFIVGGLIAELIGAFVLPSSFQDLFNSVNSYNREILSEYKNR